MVFEVPSVSRRSQENKVGKVNMIDIPREVTLTPGGSLLYICEGGLVAFNMYIIS